jgi:hypothetical protein
MPVVALQSILQDVSIDHGGLDVPSAALRTGPSTEFIPSKVEGLRTGLVAQELLDVSDIVTQLQQVGGEGVAEGVGRDALGDAGLLGSPFHGFLHGVLVEVMATTHVTARVL